MGFIKLDRCIQEHSIWKGEPFSKGQAWIDLLMLANYEDKKVYYKGEVIICKRGDVNLSKSYLADRWGWSRKKVSAFLNLLEKDEMVTTKVSTHRTTITLVNYGKFQDIGTTKVSTEVSAEVTTKVSTEEQQGLQQAPITKNIKNKRNKEIKNIYNNIYYPNDEKLDSAFKDYLQMRKEKKVPTTDRAVNLAMEELQKLSSDTLGVMDNDKAIQILEKSTMRGWTGLFEIKEQKSVYSAKNNSIDWEKV